MTYPRRDPFASVRVDRAWPVKNLLDDKLKEKLNADSVLRNFWNLKFWHAVAAIVHLLSGIAILIIFLAVDPSNTRGTFTSDVTTTMGANGTVTTLKKLDADYDLFYVLIPMPFATALFHLLQFLLLFMNCRWYKGDIEKGINIIRWIEYSITASLMTFILAQLCGITNVYLVWLIGVVCNIGLQWHGYYFEVLMDCATKDTKLTWIQKWSPMIGGGIIFLGQWSILGCYFARTVIASKEDVPLFVWFAFLGTFVTFCGFPLIQVFFANKVRWFNNWYSYEWWFILLSLVSKLVLDWSLAGGILNQ
jgi:Heliorhodopsin